MSDFKIEKNVPVPARASTRYPFGEMEIDDSLLDTSRSTPQTSNMVLAARKWFKANDRKMIARKTPDGARIWRVE